MSVEKSLSSQGRLILIYLSRAICTAKCHSLNRHLFMNTLSYSTMEFKSMNSILPQNFTSWKLGIVASASKFSTWKIKGGGSGGIQGHPWLHNEFEASLSYVRPCLKTPKGRAQGAENVQWLLGALAALMEDPSSVPSTHIREFTTARNSSSRRIWHNLLAPWASTSTDTDPWALAHTHHFKTSPSVYGQLCLLGLNLHVCGKLWQGQWQTVQANATLAHVEGTIMPTATMVIASLCCIVQPAFGASTSEEQGKSLISPWTLSEAFFYFSKAWSYKNWYSTASAVCFPSIFPFKFRLYLNSGNKKILLLFF